MNFTKYNGTKKNGSIPEDMNCDLLWYYTYNYGIWFIKEKAWFCIKKYDTMDVFKQPYLTPTLLYQNVWYDAENMELWLTLKNNCGIKNLVLHPKLWNFELLWKILLYTD